MPFFQSDGVSIAFETYGEGRPVTLVHGFASTAEVNWVATGWVEAIVAAGYRAVTLDNRGHGLSQKLYRPGDYELGLLARDVIGLLNHLDIPAAALIGYSMGARIAASVALQAPGRVVAIVFGGLGINMVHGMQDTDEIALALEAGHLDQVSHPAGREFRLFAERTGSDLKALAACMRSSRAPIGERDIRSIQAPTLVATGGNDTLAGDAQALAALLPHGEAVVVPRRDHMRMTGDKAFKHSVIEFLGRVYPPSV